jgi:hypothetical protein
MMVGFGLGFPTAVALVFTQVFKIYFQPGIFGLSVSVHNYETLNWA